MTHDGPPPRHLQPVAGTPSGEPPFDPAYDTPAPPPHTALDAERAVLGAMLLTPTVIPDVTTHITGADYYQPRHETIHTAILDLHTAGTTPDAITVATELQRRGELKNIGAPYLHTLAADVPIPGNAGHYAATIHRTARLRRAATVLNQAKHALDSATTEDVDVIFGNLVEVIHHEAFNFGPTQTGPTQWAPLDLDRVLAGEEVDPPPNILTRDDGANLLYAAAVHTISGEPGSGKTWLALIAALQQLAADQIVTMVDFEDRASRVVGRLLALGATPTQIRDQFRYIRPHTALDTTARRDLEHATRDASLVILDGVTEAMTLHGLDLNGNADVANFYALLPRWIADQGPAVALIDHVVKDNEKQGRWAIGGQHKLAGIDGVAYLVQALDKFGRGKTGKARVTVSKDRPGYVEEIALGRTVAELWLDATNIGDLRHRLLAPIDAPKDEAGNMRPTVLMEKVSRWLEAAPGASRTKIEDGVTGKVTYVRRAIDRLVQEGYVEVRPGPRNTQEHRVLTPFREYDEEPQARLYD